jgi:hypothetical protein
MPIYVNTSLLTVLFCSPFSLMDLSLTLEQADPELFALVKREEKRQREHLELIASEVRLLCFWNPSLT